MIFPAKVHVMNTFTEDTVTFYKKGVLCILLQAESLLFNLPWKGVVFLTVFLL